jgi:glutaredoxin-related protein
MARHNATKHVVFMTIACPQCRRTDERAVLVGYAPVGIVKDLTNLKRIVEAGRKTEVFAVPCRCSATPNGGICYDDTSELHPAGSVH